VTRRARTALWPTRLGGKALGFYAVLLATFFAIPYANLFFLGIALLSVIAAANALWGWTNLRRVEARVGDLEPSRAGRPTTVRFTVTSEHAVHLVSGVLRAGTATCRTATRDLPAGGGELLGELPPLPRGVYPLLAAALESRYPHGLVRARRTAAAPAELVVYPAPLPAAQTPGRHGELTAAGADASPGSVGLRDWQAGDDPRSVHWKATARRSQLVVRLPDTDAGGEAEVVLDRRCDLAALEHALAAVATLALAAEEQKERLVLRTQGTAASYGRGAAPYRELMRVLALLQPLAADAPAPPAGAAGALRLPAGAAGARP
jgi:uncharacterized protein (DUF58 family)